MDLVPGTLPEVPEEFTEYCADAVLAITGRARLSLFSPDRFRGFLERISKSGIIAKRFVLAGAEAVDSLEGLTEALVRLTRTYTKEECKSFRVRYEEGVYVIERNNA